MCHAWVSLEWTFFFFFTDLPLRCTEYFLSSLSMACARRAMHSERGAVTLHLLRRFAPCFLWWHADLRQGFDDVGGRVIGYHRQRQSQDPRQRRDPSWSAVEVSCIFLFIFDYSLRQPVHAPAVSDDDQPQAPAYTRYPCSNPIRPQPAGHLALRKSAVANLYLRAVARHSRPHPQEVRIAHPLSCLRVLTPCLSKKRPFLSRFRTYCQQAKRERRNQSFGTLVKWRRGAVRSAAWSSVET